TERGPLPAHLQEPPAPRGRAARPALRLAHMHPDRPLLRGPPPRPLGRRPRRDRRRSRRPGLLLPPPRDAPPRPRPDHRPTRQDHRPTRQGPRPTQQDPNRTTRAETAARRPGLPPTHLPARPPHPHRPRTTPTPAPTRPHHHKTHHHRGHYRRGTRATPHQPTPTHPPRPQTRQRRPAKRQRQGRWRPVASVRRARQQQGRTPVRGSPNLVRAGDRWWARKVSRRVLALVAALVLVTAACTAAPEPAPEPTSVSPSPTRSAAPEPEPEVSPSEPPSPEPELEPEPSPTVEELPEVRVTDVSDVVTGLDAPWGVAFLPDGAALVTERDTARVWRLDDGELTRLHGPGADDVERATVARSEGGLLGVAVSPEFADDGLVFVYLTAAEDNRILRM